MTCSCAFIITNYLFIYCIILSNFAYLFFESEIFCAANCKNSQTHSYNLVSFCSGITVNRRTESCEKIITTRISTEEDSTTDLALYFVDFSLLSILSLFYVYYGVCVCVHQKSRSSMLSIINLFLIYYFVQKSIIHFSLWTRTLYMYLFVENCKILNMSRQVQPLSDVVCKCTMLFCYSNHYLHI